MSNDRFGSGADDHWVDAVLDDAVADVEPRDDLAGIRARIEGDAAKPRTRTRWAAGAAGLAVAATVAAVAFAAGVTTGADEDAGPAGAPAADGSAPAAGSGPTGSTEPNGSAGGPIPVYYLGDTPTGPRLYREFRAPFGREAMDRLSAAVDMAVAVPPTDPDYRSPWPDGVGATASYEGGELTVDLQPGSTSLQDRPVGTSRDEASMALQQLVHTAQAAVQQRVQVRFLLDGEVTDRLLGEATSEPLSEGDPMLVQAPVWVISPQEDTAMSSLLVEGRGAFFEANVTWQILSAEPDGSPSDPPSGMRVVREGFATAEECCTLSPFSFEVPDLSPGDYVLRVYDADMSGGEGMGEQEDTKRFTVTG